MWRLYLVWNIMNPTMQKIMKPAQNYVLDYQKQIFAYRFDTVLSEIPKFDE